MGSTTTAATTIAIAPTSRRRARCFSGNVGSSSIASASTMEKSFEGATGSVDAAKKVGKLVGERARGAGVETVVFDRGGNRYHGRVAGIADGAREAGLTL